MRASASRKYRSRCGAPSDVGVHHQCHDPGGLGSIVIALLELVNRAIVVFAGLMMLDQHHRHIVAFLHVREIDDRSWCGSLAGQVWSSDTQSQMYSNRLLDLEIRRFPGFGQAGPSQPHGGLPGKVANRRHIDNNLNRQSGAIRQFELRPLADRRKIEPLGRQHDAFSYSHGSALAAKYQSRISTPFQCSTPSWRLMYSYTASRYLIR
jgi:hypothetical protein